MTQKEFIQKYKGQAPSVTGGGRYRNWTELEQDMLADLNLLITLHQAPPVQQRIFNLNQFVLVKFKAEGYKRLADLNNDMVHLAPSIPMRSAQDFEKMANKDGYISIQMWEFIRKFGEVTGPTFKDHYFIDIIFSEKDLVPYFKTTNPPPPAEIE